MTDLTNGCRKAFEEWFPTTHGMVKTGTISGGEGYEHDLWVGWQAAWNKRSEYTENK